MSGTRLVRRPQGESENMSGSCGLQCKHGIRCAIGPPFHRIHHALSANHDCYDFLENDWETAGVTKQEDYYREMSPYDTRGI